MRRLLLATVSLALVIGLAGCGGGSSDGSSSGGSGGKTTTTAPRPVTYSGLEAAQVTFNPVVSVVACPGTTLASDSTTSTTRLPAGQTFVTSPDGKLCYVVGPAGGDGTDITDAKVYADGVGIQVQPKPESADTLNEMFNACYDGTDACPAASTDGHGYVAILVDGDVVSAPAVNGEDLASSGFVITGHFNKVQADNVAKAINGY